MIAALLLAALAAGPTIPLEGKFEKHLSAYHIFADPANQIPVDGFIPYTLTTELFTDYAEKHRWIYLPPETTITYTPDNTFAFPIGTVIVKTFAYPADAVTTISGLSPDDTPAPPPRPQVSNAPSPNASTQEPRRGGSPWPPEPATESNADNPTSETPEPLRQEAHPSKLEERSRADQPQISNAPTSATTPPTGDNLPRPLSGGEGRGEGISTADRPNPAVAGLQTEPPARPQVSNNPTADRPLRLIETRLLIHQTDGWVAAAYLWNETQTDATLKVAGARVPITFTDPAGRPHTTDYLVPNMNQCKACHRGTGTTQPIGPKARHLNRPYDYPTGPENQLTHWADLGILEGLPNGDTPDAVAGLPASPSEPSREVGTEPPPRPQVSNAPIPNASPQDPRRRGSPWPPNAATEPTADTPASATTPPTGDNLPRPHSGGEGRGEGISTADRPNPAVAGLQTEPPARPQVSRETPADRPLLLSHLPHVPAIDDTTAPLDQRAKAYLDINCAHCHNPHGLASITQLDLRWIQDDPLMRGILKRPTSAGPASGNRYYAIQPGRPDESFLLTRLNSTHPDIRMPEVGRTLVHEEAAALIREWIAGLE